MEKNFKIDVKIDEEDLANLISNAIGDSCGFAWWGYDEDGYEEAKAELIAEQGGEGLGKKTGVAENDDPDVYYEVTVETWGGGEQTWKEPRIFRSKEKAEEFLKANAGTLTKTGMEAISIQAKRFEDAEKEAPKEPKPNAGDRICMEQVFARMLLNGKKLKLLDPESEWRWSGHEPGEMLWNAQIVAEGCVPVGGEWHEVGIEDIVKGIQLYGESGCCSDCGPNLKKIVEDGDFWDADAVFQFAAYGELIYG